MDLTKLRDEVHATAVSKGWWDKDPENSELLFLIITELAEAFEDYRNGKPLDVIEYEGEKPTGFPTELADAYIRILDYCGGRNISIQSWYDTPYTPTLPMNLGAAFLTLSGKLSVIMDFIATGSKPSVSLCLAEVLKGIEEIARRSNVDLQDVIKIKVAYNKTRSHRHGGKLV